MEVLALLRATAAGELRVPLYLQQRLTAEPYQDLEERLIAALRKEAKRDGAR